MHVLMSNKFSKYGGLHIVFTSNYSQLVPVRKTAIYDEDKEYAAFHGMINCNIELDRKWRFKDDPVYGERMS